MKVIYQQKSDEKSYPSQETGVFKSSSQKAARRKKRRVLFYKSSNEPSNFDILREEIDELKGKLAKLREILERTK